MSDDFIPVIESLGYTRREAAFLYLVAVHSGYFVRRQFDYFIDRNKGAIVRNFLAKGQAAGHIEVIEYAPGLAGLSSALPHPLPAAGHSGITASSKEGRRSDSRRPDHARLRSGKRRDGTLPRWPGGEGRVLRSAPETSVESLPECGR